MPAPQIILDLVQRFSDSRDEYRSGHYNEAQLRREFLDPFFTALGWDLTNQQGYAPQYREVIQEASLNIEGQSKAPDYEFRIGQTPKFFVEAKKPAVNIQYDIHPAFQLRRYAWSAHLPLSILTDFEEFAVYDTRIKPNFKDAASVARTFFFRYTDYAEKWDEIAAIFAKASILKGSFDRYVQDNKAKKGTTEVDDDFLSAIEAWRELLARNIALRNPLARTERALNYAVQMTLDRLIFLRICEDRGIEPERQLDELTKTPEIYPRLVSLFIKADQKYNSGLFHFSKEKTQTTDEDTFTLSLAIDDKVLKQIIRDLYYPESPYAFKVIPVEILGQVYEQFLGKVIRLTPAGQAKVEEKPEVRKAGGVYYTPSYIVTYIVQNTVGKLLEGKTPQQAASLRVVDPACGSGSFLLGAYQHLLDWHLSYYLAPENGGPQAFIRGKSPALLPSSDGGFHLTTAEKKRILINNIYGVDIDHQAVEVTKLSLLLKLLEEETGQLSLGFERVLPDLGHNIRCGNSLIGWDYFQSQLLADEEEIRRVNPFDWQQAFPEVFAVGGFDAVIGNPPYIRTQVLKTNEYDPTKYYKLTFQSAGIGNYDIYVLFIERGTSILNKVGILGFILPNKFMAAKYGEPVRGLISEKNSILKIVDFGDQQIFANATTYTCLLFLSGVSHPEFSYEKVKDINLWQLEHKDAQPVYAGLSFSKRPWVFIKGGNSALVEKLNNQSNRLGNVSNFFVGLQTSADTVFLFKNTNLSNGELTEVHSKELEKPYLIESAILKKVVRSGQIGKYWAEPTALLLFPYNVEDKTFQLFSEEKMKSDFPNAWDYLLASKQLLAAREHGKFRNKGWYQLYPKNLSLWEQPKIMIPYMVKELSAYFDLKRYYFVNVTTGGFGLTVKNPNYSELFLTALLNSRLMDWVFVQSATQFHGGYFGASKQYLENLPIKNIVKENLREFKIIEDIICLSKILHESCVTKSITPVENSHSKSVESRNLNYIEHLIYELYSLTSAEIALLEG
jgi:hypothetical protein